MNADSVYLPKSATIKSAQKLTTKEILLSIELDSKQPLGHQPGQFVEVSISGIGEAPISVSSSPTVKDTFELCVRNVGSVTNAIHQMKAGDKVGIRGPFGKGFDTEFLKGKDILFMCAGLGVVPLRSLINYVLDNRADYGKLTILYGCKTPDELLFKEEIQSCKMRDDLKHCMTVDKVLPGQCWTDNVGVITTLIPKVEFDPKTTYAVVVGPPIMYKFAIKALKERGVADDHIIVSLERRMKCGIGKCGHCQINHLYCCKDGPVFNYADIKDVKEAL